MGDSESSSDEGDAAGFSTAAAAKSAGTVGVELPQRRPYRLPPNAFSYTPFLRSVVRDTPNDAEPTSSSSDSTAQRILAKDVNDEDEYSGGEEEGRSGEEEDRSGEDEYRSDEEDRSGEEEGRSGEEEDRSGESEDTSGEEEDRSDEEEDRSGEEEYRSDEEEDRTGGEEDRSGESEDATDEDSEEWSSYSENGQLEDTDTEWEDSSSDSSSGSGAVQPYTGRPTSIDINKNWEQCVEKRDPGLKKRLNERQIKEQEARYEVVKTVAKYYQKMDLTCNHYLKNISIIPTIDITRLFSNMKEVRDTTGKLLRALEELWKRDTMLTNLFTVLIGQFEDMAKVHVIYAGKYKSVLRYLEERTAATGDLRELLNNLNEHPLVTGTIGPQDLKDFLHVPIEAVTKYHMPINAVINNMAKPTEHDMKVLTAYKKMGEDCDKAVEMEEKAYDMHCVVEKTDFSKVPPISLNNGSRYLVREDNVVVYKFQGRHNARKFRRLFLLFNDLVLICKKKRWSGENDMYIAIVYGLYNQVHLYQVDARPNTENHVRLTINRGDSDFSKWNFAFDKNHERALAVWTSHLRT